MLYHGRGQGRVLAVNGFQGGRVGLVDAVLVPRQEAVQGVVQGAGRHGLQDVRDGRVRDLGGLCVLLRAGGVRQPGGSDAEADEEANQEGEQEADGGRHGLGQGGASRGTGGCFLTWLLGEQILFLGGCWGWEVSLDVSVSVSGHGCRCGGRLARGVQVI